MVVAAVQKSPDAFRTISEVATELSIPQHVLRFWEGRFAQVKPLKRGGGRRYYRPDDVDLLRGICSLLYRDGLTIKGVQKILREQGVRYVMELGRGSLSLLESKRAAHPTLVERWPAEEPADDGAAAPQVDFSSDDYGGSAGASEGSLLPQAERARFETLLEELLVLKDRLSASRARLLS